MMSARMRNISRGQALFFLISFSTIVLFLAGFILFVVKYGKEEYIPSAGILTYDYWNQIVHDPELINDALADAVIKAAVVSSTVFGLEIVGSMAFIDLFKGKSFRKILLLFVAMFILYRGCRWWLIKCFPIYRMFMLLLPALFLAFVLLILNLCILKVKNKIA